MNLKSVLFPGALVAAVIVFPGCASTTESRGTTSDVVVEVEPAHRTSGTIDTIAATRASNGPSRPSLLAPARALPTLDESPVPVYRNAEVVAVEMDAYVNEKGELVAPTKKWVVRRPGAWDLTAARNPERAYVPAENVPVIPQAPGSYTPMVSPVSTPVGEAPVVATPSKGIIDIAGVKNVRVTGFTSESDRAKAQAMVGPGEVLFKHPTLGFIVVPQSFLLETPVSIEGAAGLTPQARRAAVRQNSSAASNEEDIGTNQ